MITEDYVSENIARLLQEKGFDVPCFSYYEWFRSGVTLYKGFLQNYSTNCINYNKDHNIHKFSRPTLQMTMKWLREVHKLHFTINPFCGQNGKICYNILVTNEEFDVILYNNIDKEESYEKACENTIEFVLNNLI